MHESLHIADLAHGRGARAVVAQDGAKPLKPVGQAGADLRHRGLGREHEEVDDALGEAFEVQRHGRAHIHLRLRGEVDACRQPGRAVTHGAGSTELLQVGLAQLGWVDVLVDIDSALDQANVLVQARYQRRRCRLPPGEGRRAGAGAGARETLGDRVERADAIHQESELLVGERNADARVTLSPGGEAWAEEVGGAAPRPARSTMRGQHWRRYSTRTTIMLCLGLRNRGKARTRLELVSGRRVFR